MGREMYQRCAKTLMQQGNSLDSVYATFTGMPMEIIPTQHPYRIKTTSSAAFQVLYKGKPLQHALVLAWHKTNGKTTHTTARSDADGRVVFPINPAGSWMISAVHMVPYENATEADWQSYWASYTFGYQ
ncbi:MAG: DUF4198 domain-containing protein [Sphingobacteriales bacterium]|nr:MAG: DUF4198 domain-containing protein [Sphingobacteriales bacterium]